jgi:hypothetical protein
MGIVPGDEPVGEAAYIGHVGRLREARLMLETSHDRAQPRGGPLRLYEQRARDELRRVVPVERGLEVLGAGRVRRVDREKPSLAIGGPQRGQQRGQQRDDNQ